MSKAVGNKAGVNEVEKYFEHIIKLKNLNIRPNDNKILGPRKIIDNFAESQRNMIKQVELLTVNICVCIFSFRS